MLLAEDLLLLLTRDETGKLLADSTRANLGLAGGVLLDLAEQGRVRVSGRGEDVKEGRLVVVDVTPTGDAVLDEALRRLATKGARKPHDLLPTLAKGLREQLLRRLVDRGVLRAEEGRILKIFRRRCWPAVDSAREAHVRESLRDVLVRGRTPTVREAGLVSLLSAIDRVVAVFPDTGIADRELRRQAKAVARSSFAGEAVRKAVDAVNAAVTASVATAAVAATGAEGG